MMPLMSEKDMSLIQALKPFLSDKSQGMLDVMVTVLKVFKPLQEGEGVDVDALATLMDMVQTSQQSKHMAKKHQKIDFDKKTEVVDDFGHPSNFHSESEDLENLLTLLSEKS